jgi:hypothetical protein
MSIFESNKNIMPTIAMFFGIIIRMYYAPKEHNPPHIHVYYQNYRATYLIEDGNLQNGDLPSKQQRMIQAWIEIHKMSLLPIGNCVRMVKSPFQLNL